MKPVQAFARNQALGPARGGEDVADGTRRARGPVGHVPAVGAEGGQGLVEHRLGGDLGGHEGLGREQAAGKVAR
ncbi:hypothetical protein D3C71_2136430 [compost metagenome]